MARWMDIAWKELGEDEIRGPEHNEAILEYFRDAGRADIEDDETAWCMAFYVSMLARAGIKVTIPRKDILLARSALTFGQRIDVPRVGCGVVVSRDGASSWKAHVGFVSAIKADAIEVLGGNQGNSVSVRTFPKSQVIGYVWPEAVTPKELEKRGSRIAKAAKEQKKDAAKGGGAQVIPDPSPAATAAAPSAPAPAPAAGDGLSVPGDFPSLGDVADHANGLQSYTDTVASFLSFGAAQWPWIIFALSIYWLARMAWNGWRIGRWRAEDASTGKTQDATPAPELVEEAA